MQQHIAGFPQNQPPEITADSVEERMGHGIVVEIVIPAAQANEISGHPCGQKTEELHTDTLGPSRTQIHPYSQSAAWPP